MPAPSPMRLAFALACGLAAWGALAGGARAQTEHRGPIAVVREAVGAAPVRIAVRGRFVAETPPPDGARRGVLNGVVRLYLRRSGDPFSFAHLAAPGEGLERHRHYDVLDGEGRFAFDFTLAADLAPGDSAYDEVVVVLASTNQAAELRAPARGLLRRTAEGFPAETAFSLAESARAPLHPTRGADADVGEVLVGGPEGFVLRYAALAQALVRARYSGDPPAGFGPVPVRWGRLRGRQAGLFQTPPSGVRVLLDSTKGLNFNTVAHEVGHYVLYVLSGRNVARYMLRDRAVREGWAIFYSFAARSHAAAAYGDRSLRASNTEVAPFQGNADGRLAYISYAHSHPDFPATAAFLWTLYDGYDDGPFEAPAYHGADNDDLSGHGLRVFETVRHARGRLFDRVSPRALADAFVAGPPGFAPLPPDEAASVEAAWRFLGLDDPATVRRPPSAPMRPPQAAHLRPDGAGLVWTPRRYRTDQPWANPPDGYRLDRHDGAGWVPVATLPPEATRAPGPLAPGRYRLTAFNAAGDAARPPEAVVPARATATD